jgi:hypothetical protein
VPIRRVEADEAQLFVVLIVMLPVMLLPGATEICLFEVEIAEKDPVPDVI